LNPSNVSLNTILAAAYVPNIIVKVLKNVQKYISIYDFSGDAAIFVGFLHSKRGFSQFVFKELYPEGWVMLQELNSPCPK